ncbi:MAG TPA: MFS transporter, partial [Sulfurimonas sp.]|nr:MFS transporter [Sulfurimonas sp.]
HHTLGMYQAIIGVITFFIALRLIFYQLIPELEKSSTKKGTFRKSFLKVLTIREYIPFCSYCFLLTLFTGACPQIFNLIEKDVIKLTNVDIVFIGNLLVVGALAGFFLGGRMVDRLGTKYVFLSCHFSFASILFLFIFRDYFPAEKIIIVGILTILFGMVQAASSIAMTSETLLLIPSENKSLATGFWFTFYSGGIGLSGVLCGQALDLGLLSDSWTLLGQPMSHYDGLLLICGTMILLMTVTLGLIPSFIQKTPARWIPHNQ